jgi:hypothetical protein
MAFPPFLRLDPELYNKAGENNGRKIERMHGSIRK